MINRRMLTASVALVVLAASGRIAADETPQTPVTYPVADVPQIMTLQGEFVRLAYNNEGYAVMGYRMAQEEAGNPWVLLKVGVTLRQGAKDQTMKRENFSIKTPDGKIIPLATQQEYMSDASLRPLDMRAKMFNDSVNYFPPGANRACPIQFFADMSGPGLAYDSFDLSDTRACVGRLYFKIPGGIQLGQHWLRVKFANSTVEVPFRILTKDQQKELRKRWEKIKKDYDELTK